LGRAAGRQQVVHAAQVASPPALAPVAPMVSLVERSAAQTSVSSMASTSQNQQKRPKGPADRRTRALERTVSRLETKLLGSQKGSQLQWEEELVLERLLELSHERIRRLAAQDLTRPDVGEHPLHATDELRSAANATLRGSSIL
jgi:hypothetical protein